MADEPENNVVHLGIPLRIGSVLEREAAKQGISVEKALKRAVKLFVKYDKQEKRKKKKSKKR